MLHPLLHSSAPYLYAPPTTKQLRPYLYAQPTTKQLNFFSTSTTKQLPLPEYIPPITNLNQYPSLELLVDY